MTLPSFELSFAGLTATPALSVDGLMPQGPNLSHWPGNRTPNRWRSDLTTGICLRFSAASEADQRDFLGDVRTIANDHYDTDGFLALLTLLEPELVLEHRELCLLTARTGDFQIYTSDRAFAIDAIVRNLAREGSPWANEFASLKGAERNLARYRWLCEHAREILEATESMSQLFTDELEVFQQEYAGALAGAVTRKIDHSCGLAILDSQTPIHRCVANTLAGQYRVLTQVHARSSGPSDVRYLYYDRAESWFDVCTIAPPPRVDLRPVAQKLSEMESGLVEWHADPPTHPVPELYCGTEHATRPGQARSELASSSLDLAAVHAVLGGALQFGPAQ